MKKEKFLKKARKAILKCAVQIFDNKIKLSEVIVNNKPITGFSAIPDIAYVQLLIKAYNKEQLISEKPNGKYRYITFDYTSHLMISTGKHKLIMPADSLGQKLGLFNAFKEEILENKCEICDVDSTKFCSKCKQVYYCGAEHQKEDWSRHKLVCKKPEIVTTNPILMEYERLKTRPS